MLKPENSYVLKKKKFIVKALTFVGVTESQQYYPTIISLLAFVFNDLNFVCFYSSTSISFTIMSSILLLISLFTIVKVAKI